MLRREREAEREMADALVLLRPVQSLQNGGGFSGKFEQTGSAKKERVGSVPQGEQLERTPETFLPKGKGTESSAQIIRM